MCREGFTSLKADQRFLSKVLMAKVVHRFYLQDPLNIFHMRRVNKYCTSPINNPITSSLSVDNAWVKQTIYASASIFTESTAILNLFSFPWSWSEESGPIRGTPMNTKHRRGGGAGEQGLRKIFTQDCTSLLTHFSHRAVYEEIRKDEG